RIGEAVTNTECPTLRTSGRWGLIRELLDQSGIHSLPIHGVQDLLDSVRRSTQLDLNIIDDRGMRRVLEVKDEVVVALLGGLPSSEEQDDSLRAFVRAFLGEE